MLKTRQIMLWAFLNGAVYTVVQDIKKYSPLIKLEYFQLSYEIKAK